MRASVSTFSVVVSALVLAGVVNQATGADHTVTVQDGQAVGVLAPSGTAIKLGKIAGDQVEMYAMYGGKKLPLKEVQEKFATIDTSGAENDRALIERVQSTFIPAYKWAGIWKLESIKEGRKTQKSKKEDPDYLALRKNMTFQIIKKGRSANGTWDVTEDGKLSFKIDPPANAEITGFKALGKDKFELTAKDEGKAAVLTYSRTDLKQEPKAADRR